MFYQKIEWLGLFSDDKLGIKNASPAQLLQSMLEGKWALGVMIRI